MKYIGEDGKKHREFTKTDTTEMAVEQVRELYDRLRDYAKHLVDLQHDMKQKMKANNLELHNIKVQMSRDRKQLKKELREEMVLKKKERESKEEKNKRLKEEFMKLL